VPKAGFKSYALKEKLYDFWKNEFEDNKKELYQLGITSFSAYLTSIMSKSLEGSPSLPNESFMRMIYLKNNLLAIQDNVQNRVVDLLIKNGKITCLFDKKDDCMHVGFAYSIPSVNKLLNNKKTNH
jgi:hypothetical protein